MWTDVVDLRDFYGSALGQTARRLIRQRIRELWPNVTGERVLGLGYATPYLAPFRDEAERTLAIMPAQQGVLHWPPEGPGLVALADEAALPLPDLSVDRVLLIHAVEYTEQLRPMLREVWRVLRAGGKVLIVVPNRRGIWARLERTPFGFGHPYSGGQLSRLLRDTMFTPVRTERALFVPPSRSRMVQATAQAWEQIGHRLFQAVAGVVLVEAGKQIYAAGVTAARPLRRIVELPADSTPTPAVGTRAKLRLIYDAAERRPAHKSS